MPFSLEHHDVLTLKGEARADLVSGDLRGDVVQPLGVKSKTEGSADTGAESLSVTYRNTRQSRARGHIEENIPRARIPELLIFALTNAAASR